MSQRMGGPLLLILAVLFFVLMLDSPSGRLQGEWVIQQDLGVSKVSAIGSKSAVDYLGTTFRIGRHASAPGGAQCGSQKVRLVPVSPDVLTESNERVSIDSTGGKVRQADITCSNTDAPNFEMIWSQKNWAVVAVEGHYFLIVRKSEAVLSGANDAKTKNLTMAVGREIPAVQFHDGRARGEQVFGDSQSKVKSPWSAAINSVVWGDLDGTGSKTGALVINYGTGGTYWIVAACPTFDLHGRIVVGGCAYIPNNMIQNASIDKQRLILTGLAHGGSDKQGEPTKHQSWTFKLEGIQLVLEMSAAAH